MTTYTSGIIYVVRPVATHVAGIKQGPNQFIVNKVRSFLCHLLFVCYHKCVAFSPV